MSDLITDAMVEIASEALHDESCPRSLRGSVEDCCDWTPWARAALEAAAPLIAAKAWEEGYAASQLEWEHVMSHSGHTVEPDDPEQMCTTCGQGSPYERNTLGASHD